MDYTEKEKIIRQLDLLKKVYTILKTEDVKQDIQYLERKLKFSK